MVRYWPRRFWEILHDRPYHIFRDDDGRLDKGFLDMINFRHIRHKDGLSTATIVPSVQYT